MQASNIMAGVIGASLLIGPFIAGWTALYRALGKDDPTGKLLIGIPVYVLLGCAFLVVVYGISIQPV